MLIFVLAIGLSLIFGMLDVLNLAHGSLYLLGSYMGYELVENRGVPFILAAAISIAFGVALGLASARSCGRSAGAGTSTRCCSRSGSSSSSPTS